VLGGVFLCVTGAEALYADMGHFGPKPIRVAWTSLVFPSLILNYAGQAALVLEGAPTDGNIFYRLCPTRCSRRSSFSPRSRRSSRANRSSPEAFSMTRQAMQLGWLPRLVIKQTSEEGYGQIYVGAVNWLLMIVTLGLTLGFGRSDNLAAAYGIAVSLTMLITSVLLFIAMREIWGWSLSAAGAVAVGFLVIDGAFFAANISKVLEGGYVPLLLAIAVYGVMWIWHRGASSVQDRLEEALLPIDAFIAELQSRKIARVPEPRCSSPAPSMARRQRWSGTFKQKSLATRVRRTPIAHRRFDAARRATTAAGPRAEAPSSGVWNCDTDLWSIPTCRRRSPNARRAVVRSILTTLPITSGSRQSCRERTGAAFHAGRRRSSRRWAGTRRAPATFSICRMIHVVEIGRQISI